MKQATCFSLALLALVSGCAMDAATEEELLSVASEESDVRDSERANTLYTYDVYAFKGGTWEIKKYQSNGVVLDTKSGAFGIASDIPLVTQRPIGDVQIGTYGKTGDRLGHFYFDENGNRSWNSGDYDKKFKSDAKTTDIPFVAYGQLRGKVNGSCQPLYNSGGGLLTTVTGRMVGIKRGEKIYLDADGNGTWGGANHCDISGDFGLSEDLPFATKGPNSHPVIGVTNKSHSYLQWHFDNNFNLAWNPPTDTTATEFGVTTDYVPSCLQTGLAVQRGRHVGFDSDGSRHWTNSDLWLNNALQDSTWKLASVIEAWTPGTP